VGHVLVDNDAVDELRLLHFAADLTVHLDQLKVDVPPLQVRDRQNRIHGDLGDLAVTPVDTTARDG
jgi:hypothetical protein